MRLSLPTPKDWLLLVVAIAVCATAVIAVTTNSAQPPPTDTTASTAAGPVETAVLGAQPPPVRSRTGIATTRRTTLVRVVASTDGEVVRRLRAGISLPVRAESNDFLRIETPCERDGWVRARDVIYQKPAPKHVSALKDATIVIDPGHGGIDSGAVGPRGLLEKGVNLEISKRLQALLRPARVVITRDGDYTAGLDYRTDIATALGAQVFVSVHNNSSPQIRTDQPGTETYYQLKSKPSKRLAGLTYEELLRTLRRFSASWVSQRDAGAKYRINERGIDYYHVLRTSRPPAVIIEGLYISNAPEEALLRREDVRDLMARALANAITRFITTDDLGSGFVTPLPRASGPVYRTPSTCRDPA
jgi:N-acetylmuramoyl-L-alanine amidase